jgi:hypothetical protein
VGEASVTAGFYAISAARNAKRCWRNGHRSEQIEGRFGNCRDYASQLRGDRSLCPKYARVCFAFGPERKAYHAYGLERGNLFQIFLNPKIWSATLNSRKKGYTVETPPDGQDAMQMSGTFIISRKGRIELPYYYDHIADHPPLDLLLSGVLSTRWDRSFDGPVGSGVD